MFQDALYLQSLILAWSLVLCGILSGAGIGLFFYQSSWFQGYDSFSRRILRLGHISCFGLPILNTLLLLVLQAMQIPASAVQAALILWMIGMVSMPTICFLSAWKHFFRHLFFIPVTSVFGGTSLLLWHWSLL